MTGNSHLADLSLAARCADHLEREFDTILGVLTKYESHEAASEEIHSSIDTLRNLHLELTYLRQCQVASVAVFLPINLPLYSLVLFAAVPSLMSDRVDVRLPAATPEWLYEVAEVAGMAEFFPRVHLHEMTRRGFIENVARPAQAVVFTGRFESAEQVRRQCPNALFIFQGSGVNPIVIGPGARLTEEVMADMVTARIFNGGQDCAAPDAYLVHSSKIDEFTSALSAHIDGLVEGTYGDPDVRVGKILNPGPLKDVAERLATLASDTVFGGTVDLDAAYVAPTVVVRPMAEHDETMEFFAPIFYVLVYDTDEELKEFFARDDYIENAMYVSLYGQEAVHGLFESSTVLFNRTVLDVEQGNTAFGGNGSRANYVALGNEVTVGPVLISQALVRTPQPRPVTPLRSRPVAEPAYARA